MRHVVTHSFLPNRCGSGSAGRRLLQTPVDAAFAELPVSDLGKIITVCSTCQAICENVDDLRSLSGFIQSDASLEALLVSECQNGVSVNASQEHSHCQPVCWTIPSESCDLYPDDCRCEAGDDEGTITSVRHVRLLHRVLHLDDSGPGDGPYFPDESERIFNKSSHPPDDEDWDLEHSPFLPQPWEDAVYGDGYSCQRDDRRPNACILQGIPLFLSYHQNSVQCLADGSCPKGCYQYRPLLESQKEFVAGHSSDIDRGVDALMEAMAQIAAVDPTVLTTETVCQISGWCSFGFQCGFLRDPSCSDCSWCANLTVARELHNYLVKTPASELNRKRLRTSLTQLTEQHYGKDQCEPECGPLYKSKKICESNPSCGWFHSERGWDDEGEMTEEPCVCTTTSSEEFRCSLTGKADRHPCRRTDDNSNGRSSESGTCTEGCELDADLLLKTQYAAMNSSRELFSNLGNASFHVSRRTFRTERFASSANVICVSVFQNVSMTLSTWSICQYLNACRCHGPLRSDRRSVDELCLLCR